MSRLTSLFSRFRSVRVRPTAPVEPETDQLWLIVGLGNPGPAYQRSRHNLGFMVLDHLAARNGIQTRLRKFKADCRDGRIGKRPALLAQPQTFYNLSGESVASLVNFFKLPPERLIVVHDDLDLESGRLRVKRGGGDAGNRGIRSLAEALATTDFVRVRIGIGRPAEGQQAADYVLMPLRGDESGAFEEPIDRAAQAIETIIAYGLETAMGRYNQRA